MVAQLKKSVGNFSYDDPFSLPVPSSHMTTVVVCFYLLLAFVALLRCLSVLTHRKKNNLLKKKNIFQLLVSGFCFVRAISLLYTHDLHTRENWNRLAICVLFTIVFYQVVYWIGIVNPSPTVTNYSYSTSTFRRFSRVISLWNIFWVVNVIFYAIIYFAPNVKQLNGRGLTENQLFSSTLLPVFSISIGSLLGSVGLLYSSCKMQTRVNRVLQRKRQLRKNVMVTSSGGLPSIRNINRLDENVQIKLNRALLFLNVVMVICSFSFLMRTFFYVQGPFTHNECGQIKDPNVCLLVGYFLPEWVPTALLLLLMWEVEPKTFLRAPGAQGHHAATSNNSAMATNKINTMEMGIQDKKNHNEEKGNEKTSLLSLPDEKMLLSTSVPGAFSLLNNSYNTFTSPTTSSDLFFKEGILNNALANESEMETGMNPRRNQSADNSLNEFDHVWLSFNAENLTFPTEESKYCSSFVVLNFATTEQSWKEIGRTELVGSNNPLYQVMIPINILSFINDTANSIIEIAVYAALDKNTTGDLSSQWLIGQASLNLNLFYGGTSTTITFGKVEDLPLFSPLSRSTCSGILNVCCEAPIISHDLVCCSSDYKSQANQSEEYIGRLNDDRRITRGYIYRTTEESKKKIVQEDLIESPYTWEIPYQLLQLILADAVMKMKKFRSHLQENVHGGYDTVHSLNEKRQNNIQKKRNVMMSTASQLTAVHEEESESSRENTSEEDDDDDEENNENSGGGSSGGLLNELIYQLRDDVQERKELKWRSRMLVKMYDYIDFLEETILQYKRGQYDDEDIDLVDKSPLNSDENGCSNGSPKKQGQTFKASTMKKNSALRFVALNLHQQMLIIDDSLCSAACPNNEEMDQTINQQSIAEIAAAVVGEEKSDHNNCSSDEDEVVRRDANTTNIEVKQALRRRIVSYDSAETIVKHHSQLLNASAGSTSHTNLDSDTDLNLKQRTCVVLPREQRILAETIVAMQRSNISNDNITKSTPSKLPPRSPPLKPVDAGNLSSVPMLSTARIPFQGEGLPDSKVESLGFYGIVTVGAFAAHVYGFRHGGIRQLQQENNRLIQCRLKFQHQHRNTSSKKGIHNTDEVKDVGNKEVKGNTSYALTMQDFERKEAELTWEIERRMEVCFLQAVSALITSFQQTLAIQLNSHNDRYFDQLLKCGFLFSVESLLSTLGNEAGMLGDMDAAIKELSRLHIKLRLIGSSTENKDGTESVHNKVAIYSTPNGIVVELPLVVSSQQELKKAPPVLQDCTTGAVYISKERIPVDVMNTLLSSQNSSCPMDNEVEDRNVYISVIPVLFSQGLNEMQTVANKIGSTTLQRQINTENFEILQNYVGQYSQFLNNSDVNDIFQSLLGDIEAKIVYQQTSREKTMDILSLTSLLAREMCAGRVTVCKSAKDRSSMAVTLEETRFLRKHHALPLADENKFCQILRSHGVRRENVRKNIGRPQYCFSRLQNYMLPPDYQCPPGTGGGGRSLS